MTTRFAMALTVAALLGIAPVRATAHDAHPFSKWFKYSADAEAHWEFIANPSNPNELRIRHKGEQAARPRRVFVLYPRASSAYDIAINRILTVFENKELYVDFTVANFELNDATAKTLLKKAQDEKYDLIFSMGSESTAWLWDHYRGGSIPVVSVCSKDPVQLGQMPHYEVGSGTNFAFTSLNIPIEVQMAYVRDLKPGLKNLAVLVDAKNVSAVQTQAEPIAKYGRSQGIQVLWGAVQDPARAREELVRIVSDAVKTMHKNDPDFSNSLFWVTGSTSVFKEIRTINEYADRVPVVSVVPEIVTAGKDTAVMSVGISFESNAHLAAIYGADVLQGRAKAGQLKVGLVSPPDIAISFLKAREIGMRIPFHFFETATFVYDYQGRAVRGTSDKKLTN